jgi:hypothetical protein
MRDVAKFRNMQLHVGCHLFGKQDCTVQSPAQLVGPLLLDKELSLFCGTRRPFTVNRTRPQIHKIGLETVHKL